MKIWVDDLRPAPKGFLWYTSSADAIGQLGWCEYHGCPVQEMSLDHDLGGDDTTRPIVLWMIEHNFWPDRVVVHSANPVGIDWLEGMIERYKDEPNR